MLPETRLTCNIYGFMRFVLYITIINIIYIYGHIKMLLYILLKYEISGTHQHVFAVGDIRISLDAFVPDTKQ